MMTPIMMLTLVPVLSSIVVIPGFAELKWQGKALSQIRGLTKKMGTSGETRNWDVSSAYLWRAIYSLACAENDIELLLRCSTGCYSWELSDTNRLGKLQKVAKGCKKSVEGLGK